MRRTVWTLLAATLLVTAQTAAAAPTAVARTAGDPIPGQYLITLKPGFDPRPVIDRIGATPLFVYGAALNGFAARLTDIQVNLLRKVPGFDRIEQDAEIGLKALEGPSRVAGSWGLDRIDQRDRPLNNIYAPRYDGSTVTAYIVDSGIQLNHPEFGGRARAGYDAVGDGRNGEDCNGHGTHVAGTVGGATYGVAKKIRLVSVRVLGCDGRGTWSGIAAGFDWISRNASKPAVVNASLGGTPATEAVDSAANNTAARGIFVAVAAGNDAADACDYTMGRAANVLTVGATTRTDGYAGYSNRGSCVQLLAPGTDINSAWIGGTTKTISGTSMATPHVTGVAALYKQTHGDRSQADVSNWLWRNATQNRIASVPSKTPNLLLYTGGL